VIIKYSNRRKAKFSQPQYNTRHPTMIIMIKIALVKK